MRLVGQLEAALGSPTTRVDVSSPAV